jgi:hypothetical protein
MLFGFHFPLSTFVGTAVYVTYHMSFIQVNTTVPFIF